MRLKYLKQVYLVIECGFAEQQHLGMGVVSRCDVLKCFLQEIYNGFETQGSLCNIGETIRI